MTVRLIEGDCLAEMPKLAAEGAAIDACVCDPPYHLTATTKRFSAENSAPAQYGRDGAMSRLSGGFMGQKWDGGNIAFRPETWAAVASVLRPGGFLLAFGGTRSYHRMTCAIEDAGFVIQDCLMWVYGSGFPKRRDMLKPSYEPVVVAYKPGGKRTLQIDECRIPGARGNGKWTGLSDGSALLGNGQKDHRCDEMNVSGRWPANLAHDGSPEVMEAFAEQSERAGVHGSGHARSGRFGNAYDASSYHLGANGAREMGRFGDTGSPARFFYSAKAGDQDRWTTPKHELTISWTSENGHCRAVLLVATALSPPKVIAASGSMDAGEWSTFLFGSGLTALCQKASKSTIKMTTNSTIEFRTWNWLTRLLTNDFTPVVTWSTGNGSNHAEHAASTGLSISFMLAETASLPNANHVLLGASFEISVREKHGFHPTVKPVELMKWLVQLVTPIGGTVLDPFAGSGTTGVAVLATGRNAILVEQSAEYCSDIRERLAHYKGSGRHSLVSKARNRHAEPLGGLFATDEAAE